MSIHFALSIHSETNHNPHILPNYYQPLPNGRTWWTEWSKTLGLRPLPLETKFAFRILKSHACNASTAYAPICSHSHICSLATVKDLIEQKVNPALYYITLLNSSLCENIYQDIFFRKEDVKSHCWLCAVRDMAVPQQSDVPLFCEPCNRLKRDYFNTGWSHFELGCDSLFVTMQFKHCLRGK